MSTMNEDKKIEFKVVNAETGHAIDLCYDCYYGCITVSDLIDYLIDKKFLAQFKSEEYYWACYFDEKRIYWNDELMSVGIKTGSRIVLRKKKMEEISLKIFIGFGGYDVDIDVPITATVGDVISGLIGEGILHADTAGLRNELYYENNNEDISTYIKYDDRSKTIEEYGWQNGQTIIAVSEGVAYGCPTAKDLPGLVPECMLLDFKGFIVGEV